MRKIIVFLMTACLCASAVILTACDNVKHWQSTSESTQSSSGAIELPEDKFD